MALSIPFRQQLPRETVRTLDSLVPNIKKDILGSISSRNLSDFIDWTEVPFVTNYLGVTDVGATITPTASALVNFRYTVFALTMTMMLNTGFVGTTGNPGTISLQMPGGFKINCNSVNRGDEFSVACGAAQVINNVGPFAPRGLPVFARSARSDSQGTIIYISPVNSNDNFGGPGDSTVYLHLLLTLPLLEWRV